MDNTFEKELSYEKAYSRLEEIVEKMSSAEVPLEELEEVQSLIRDIESLGSARAIVRYSGTENKMRILVEAPDRDTVEVWTKKLVDAAKRRIG